ncbi:hypothetical protein EIP91_001347 [Steccherinum ochraceum]|uniref:CxC5 like cysteine cluster associated with KDZ domain-containing protein n=1 Tax=Steccherinum ochraceum TaxID=92696 RepID=A0A4V2MWI7_9APHY|nr:hypothetical protein EIP91_001347 [Steccherinum ochraceum]
MSDQLHHLLAQLQDTTPAVTLTQVIRFIGHASCVKDYIVLCQRARVPHNTIPPFIPSSVASLLSEASHISQEEAAIWWTVLKDLIWDEVYVAGLGISTADLQTQPNGPFHRLCTGPGISAFSFYPRSLYCSSPQCQSKQTPLKKAEIKRVVFFTKDHGPLPAHDVHMYCRNCNANYHHNYSVWKGTRTYHAGTPDSALQVGEHQYVETRLIRHWINAMIHGWNSARNSASLYNTDYTHLVDRYKDHLGAVWPCTFKLEHSDVWDGFALLSLLKDSQGQDTVLKVPHGGLQRDRFTEAMKARNTRIKICGYPELLHYCNRCTRIMTDENGGQYKVSAMVIDGVTMGHACCAEFNCKEPLQKQNDRFCKTHSHLNSICSIFGCTKTVLKGSRACSDPTHQVMEVEYKDTNKSSRQLRQRLDHAKRVIAQEEGEEDDSLDSATHEPDQEFEVDLTSNTARRLDTLSPVGEHVAPNEPGCQEVSAQATAGSSAGKGTMKKKIRTQFGRKRTHNEQIMVAPCGVIGARETFYGAEAVGSVAEFMKRTYERIFLLYGIRPDHFIFDNNCSVARHVKDDPWFDGLGLTVDVFHFKSKHKATDYFCQTKCNPANFPELIGENGEGWFFNSSACEQNNVWTGGFQSMCREMRVDKYNFLLDEMFMEKNKLTIAELKRQGCNPGYWKAGDIARS